MRIFLTGARGYIGAAVAKECLKAGHEVLGLTHSPDKAAQLKALGVEPVIGNIKEPNTFRKSADACNVLIHAAVEYTPEGPAADKIALEALAASARSAKDARLLIYTSGVWVLGAHAGKPLDETARLNPVAAVAWRPDHEALALGAARGNAYAVVLRPGCVYGGAAGLYGMMIQSAVEKGAIRLVGDGTNRWASIYLADLARLYRLIAEKRPERATYHATDESVEQLGDAAQALLTAAGGEKLVLQSLDEARKAMGPFADALALNQRVSSAKARTELGWTPELKGVVPNAAKLVAEWRAARG